MLLRCLSKSSTVLLRGQCTPASTSNCCPTQTAGRRKRARPSTRAYRVGDQPDKPFGLVVICHPIVVPERLYCFSMMSNERTLYMIVLPLAVQHDERNHFRFDGMYVPRCKLQQERHSCERSRGTRAVRGATRMSCAFNNVIESREDCQGTKVHLS